jgi:hypothetical protein
MPSNLICFKSATFNQTWCCIKDLLRSNKISILGFLLLRQFGHHLFKKTWNDGFANEPICIVGHAMRMVV